MRSNVPIAFYSARAEGAECCDASALAKQNAAWRRGRRETSSRPRKVTNECVAGTLQIRPARRGRVRAKPPARSGRHASSVLDPAAAAALALRASKPVSRPSKRPRVGGARAAREMSRTCRTSSAPTKARWMRSSATRSALCCGTGRTTTSSLTYHSSFGTSSTTYGRSSPCCWKRRGKRPGTRGSNPSGKDASTA